MITIQDLAGNDVNIPAQWQGSNLFFAGRGPPEAVVIQRALEAGVLVDGETLTPAADTVFAIQGRDILPAVLVPAVLDEAGEVVTPDEYDPRVQFNIWLGPNAVTRGLWRKWSVIWAQYGVAVADINKDEVAIVFNDIELMDPETITPSNTLL